MAHGLGTRGLKESSSDISLAKSKTEKDKHKTNKKQNAGDESRADLVGKPLLSAPDRPLRSAWRSEHPPPAPFGSFSPLGSVDGSAGGRLEPGGAAVSSSFFLHSRNRTHFTSSEVSVTAGSSLLIRGPSASSPGNHPYPPGHQHPPSIIPSSRMTNHLSFPGTLLVVFAQKVGVPGEQGGWSPHLFPEGWAPLHAFFFFLALGMAGVS